MMKLVCGLCKMNMRLNYLQDLCDGKAQYECHRCWSTYSYLVPSVVIGGIYQHFKGNSYEVLALAKHSENQEAMVVHKNVGTGEVFVRPQVMWTDDRFERMA